MFDRLAGCWTYWGWKGGYFSSEEDASAFHDELRYMLAMQMVAPNSPQWFNTGLHWAYGIDGPGQGHYYVDYKTGKLTKSKSSYEHPQPHACFIQGIEDDLVNEGGIMDLWVREARLFKYGSGTGSNFSRLRGEGERLSGGGRSSGLMSFLKIGDRAAGAIKSGGTTRRAAKMVVVDVDHPDIETYIDWKVKEEQKVAALVTGSKLNQKHLKAILKACVNCEGSGDDCFDPEKNPALRREIKLARRALVTDNMIKRVIQFAKQGYKDIDFPVYDTDWDSEAYLTVSGQNSNNSVSLQRRFPARGRDRRRLESDRPHQQEDHEDAEGARPVGEDRPRRLGVRRSRPALQHDHERLAHLQGVRRHPRVEPVLGVHVPRRHGVQPGLRQPAHLLRHRLAQVRRRRPTSTSAGSGPSCSKSRCMMAQFPSKAIAELSYEFRTLGLGYANIGGLLMTMGLPYDSKEGRALCGALTAIMTGMAYATSAEMAKELGPFPGHKKNASHMLRVIRNHRRAAHGQLTGYEGLAVNPVPLDHASCPQQDLIAHAKAAWDKALELGEQHGYRNAQTTVVAPTGTIGLVMDCDTTGIEPDFALVKFKKLAGGGYWKIINRAVPAGAAPPRLPRERDRRDRGLCRRPRFADATRPASTTRR